MKFLRNFILTLINILLIPIYMLASAGMMWYVLPDLQATPLGEWLLQLKFMSPPVILWTTIGSGIAIVVFTILKLILDKGSSVKFRNFFIHSNSWLLPIITIGLTIYTFIEKDPLQTTAITITFPIKIGIGVCLLGLVLFHIFSGKILAVINRKIQAYETSKEMQEVGKSSIVVINILKLIEIFFPEMLILVLLSLCVGWDLSRYFIIVLLSCFVPVLGNIMADVNNRKDFRRLKEIEKDKLAEKIANNMEKK